MDSPSAPLFRARRHSGASSHPWDALDLGRGLDARRPQSAPPVENRWLATPVDDDCLSDGTLSDSSERAPSDSSLSSRESSPPSTRPSSPPYTFAKKEMPSRDVYVVGHDEYKARIPVADSPLYAPLSPPMESYPPRPLYVVLERASMEICRAPPSSHPRQAKVKPTLLTCDDHQGYLVRMGREVSDARPDITHQCLLTLLDSPLNKTGLLKIFIHTTQGLLIEVHPDVRIPRTYKRYSGLMVQLLQQGEIRGASDAQVLMRVLEHPITRYLPAGCTKIALSADARPMSAPAFVRAVPPGRPLALFVGAMAKGPDDFADGLVDQKISLSRHALSASVVCAKVCCAMEDLLGIL